jgi:hypothetical protein
VIARIRDAFAGAGGYIAGAVVLFIAALLFALLGLQSPSALMWTGQAVSGSEQAGIVYYSWHGQSYTLDDRGSASASHVLVYIDPANPSDGIVYHTWDRVGTILVIGVPLVASMAVLAWGGSRNYRWKRRNIKRGTSDWWLSKVPPSQ